MVSHYKSLTERDRRHYAAVESKKLGFGSQTYICKLLGISPKTLRRGEKELLDPSLLSSLPKHRQRCIGGGRKKICDFGRK